MSRDKLDMSYLHLQKSSGYKTQQCSNILWEAPTLNPFVPNALFLYTVRFFDVFRR